MTLSKTTRTRASFREKISTLSQATINSIFIAIDNFENFSMERYGKVNLIPDLKKADEEELFDILQNWINWNQFISPRSMRSYFSHVRKYLHYMGVKLHDQDVKAELTFKHKVEEESYGLTRRDIQLILKEMRYKTRIQYLCHSSSLMRIGEIIQLRKKHLILGQKNIIVKIPSTITKFNKGRTTFFSKEATRLLEPLLKDMDDDDLIFGTSDKPSRSAYANTINSSSATRQAFRLAVKRAGLATICESTGRYTINTHAFRAFGITKLSRLDPNFAKKLAGQKGYLLQYDRMSDEEKLDLYEKYESELMIYDWAKHRVQIEKSQNKDNKIASLEQEMRKISVSIQRIESRQERETELARMVHLEEILSKVVMRLELAEKKQK